MQLLETMRLFSSNEKIIRRNILQKNVVDNLSPVVANSISLQTASQQEIVKFKISDAVKRFQKHELDTGSSAVQSKFLIDIL